MDLRPYVENIQRQLVVAGEAGGDDAHALAERLVAPLDAALRLTIQEALMVAAEEITCELAPGSVELRLRGRDLEFVVTAPPPDPSAGDLCQDADHQTRDGSPPTATSVGPRASIEGDEGGMLRINLRMADHLKARIEQAAGGEGLSVNAWLVRAASAALERNHPRVLHERRPPQGARHYTGWAR